MKSEEMYPEEDLVKLYFDWDLLTFQLSSIGIGRTPLTIPQQNGVGGCGTGTKLFSSGGA